MQVNKDNYLELIIKATNYKTDKVLLVRDHGGPNQGNTINNIFNDMKSLHYDCKYMDVVHVDVWKEHQEYEEGLRATIGMINLIYITNPNILFEIGTEEAIRKTTPEELDKLIYDLKYKLSPELFNKIKYAVIQSGTALEGNKNIGSFNQTRLIEMVNVVKKHGLISKEHNGDYLSSELVKDKFKNGLNSINIAPEFGQIETKIILSRIKNNMELFETFYQICLESKRWVKWVSTDFDPENNKEELINICGHYVFSDPRFIEIKNKLGENIDDEIKKAITNKITELIKSVNE